jgi:hypothetical protein
MDPLGFLYHRPYRVAPDRTLNDDLLWHWLDLGTNFTNGNSGYFHPIFIQQLHAIENLPSFYYDSHSFCTELVTALDTMLAGGFDIEEIQGENQAIFRLWNYARNYDHQNDIKEPGEE